MLPIFLISNGVVCLALAATVFWPAVPDHRVELRLPMVHRLAFAFALALSIGLWMWVILGIGGWLFLWGDNEWLLSRWMWLPMTLEIALVVGVVAVCMVKVRISRAEFWFRMLGSTYLLMSLLAIFGAQAARI
jgi:hypothetical protein